MDKILSLSERFALPAGEKTAVPFGNGHINNTYLITIDGVKERYILQRINSYVFIRPQEVMENMLHITEYLQERISAEGGDPDRETIRLVPSVTGEPWVKDEKGEVWRVMLCVPDTVSPQHPDDLHVLEECGKAFGCFSRRLNHFPAATLHETIIAFHDTPNRLRQLEDAISADPCGRVKDVAEEIAFARAREAETRILVEAHAAGYAQPVAVIDLDRRQGSAVGERTSADRLRAGRNRDRLQAGAITEHIIGNRIHAVRKHNRLQLAASGKNMFVKSSGTGLDLQRGQRRPALERVVPDQTDG